MGFYAMGFSRDSQVIMQVFPLLLMDAYTFEWFKEWGEFETVQKVRELEEEVRRV